MSSKDLKYKETLQALTVHEVVNKIIDHAKDGIVLIADTSGPQASLEDISDALEVVKLDVNWSWRVSETLCRIAAPNPLPYWADQTVEQLKRWADVPEQAGYMSGYLNTVEFDPLDDATLERPFVRFINAVHYNPVEITIAVSAASLTLLLIASLWAIRTWKKLKIDEGFAAAKTELIKRISAQILCDSPGQLREIETLLLGPLNSPNGLHEKGEEISISVPHLMSVRVADQERGSGDGG